MRIWGSVFGVVLVIFANICYVLKQKLAFLSKIVYLCAVLEIPCISHWG